MNRSTRLALLLIVLVCLSAPLVAVTHIGVATGPFYVAVNAATNRIYVSSSISNTVSVIDGSSNEVIATVPVTGALGIDVNPTTNTVYVATLSSVVVIDGASNSITATIVGTGPARVAVNAATNLIYAPNYSPRANSVSVIDGATNTIIATIPVGNTPYGAAVNSTANLVYVTNGASGTVSVIDGATNTVTSTYALLPFADPANIAFDAQSNRLYVTDGANRIVYVVNASTGKAAFLKGSNVPFTQPAYPAILQPGKTVLVSDDGADDCLWPISETNNKVGAALKGFNGPIGIAVNQTTHTVYVANNVGNTVSVFSY